MKQNVVSRSNAEAKYTTITLILCELIWLKQLFKEHKFEESSEIHLVCDNQVALHISSNPFFYERTKYIEVDCHL